LRQNSHQSAQTSPSGQSQAGPLMIMQRALKRTGGECQEQPEPVDADRADRVADGVAEEGVLVLRRLDRLTRAGD
jgi:hypothetical protein